MKRFITQHWFKLSLLVLLAWYVFRPTYLISMEPRQPKYYKINHVTGSGTWGFMTYEPR